ncbi:MAG: hypothetical protein DMF78_18735 [Acidobacteria bacterium]|nr:MAG: hypothetical protein DMF78_18735 [Acidobacteriota bacterium]
MSELGAVIAAADAVRVPLRGRRAIEDAIAEAAVAVAHALADDPGTLQRAREAIDTAGQVIAALDEQIAHARQLRSRGKALTVRAKELVEKARG